MTAAQERQQVTIRVDRLVEVRTRAARVVDGVVVIAGNQQQR
jgi:hypothetical protein